MKRVATLIGIIIFVAACMYLKQCLSGDAALHQSYFSSMNKSPHDFVRCGEREPLQYQFIDKLGHSAFKQRFEQACSFHDGYAAVQIGDKWGFIDRRGKVVIPAEYSAVHNFSNGLAAVKRSFYWEYIDTKGKVVIPESRAWIDVENFSGRTAVVHTWPDKVGILMRDGRYAQEPTLDAATREESNICGIKKDGKFGFVNSNGVVVVPLTYDDSGEFSEGLVAVCLNHKWGYIDKTGASVVKNSFDLAQQFHRGLAVVAVHGKFGLINKRGKFVLPPKYPYLMAISDATHSTARLSSEGSTPVMINGHWGFVDNKRNKLVIAPIYFDVSQFSEGLARVGILAEEKN